MWRQLFKSKMSLQALTRHFTAAIVIGYMLMKVSSSFKLERDPFGHYQRVPNSEDYNLIITGEDDLYEQ